MYPSLSDRQAAMLAFTGAASASAGFSAALESSSMEHKVVALLALAFGVVATGLGMNEHCEQAAYQRGLEERARDLEALLAIAERAPLPEN